MGPLSRLFLPNHTSVRAQNILLHLAMVRADSTSRPSVIRPRPRALTAQSVRSRFAEHLAVNARFTEAGSKAHKQRLREKTSAASAKASEGPTTAIRNSALRSRVHLQSGIRHQSEQGDPANGYLVADGHPRMGPGSCTQCWQKTKTAVTAPIKPVFGARAPLEFQPDSS